MLLLVAFQRLNSQPHLTLLTPAAPKLRRLAALRGLSRMHLLLWRLNQKMRAMLQLAESKRVNQNKIEIRVTLIIEQNEQNDALRTLLNAIHSKI